MSPCVGSLRGTAWGSSSFFHWLNSSCFLQPEVGGTYLPGTGTLGWWGLVWDWDSLIPISFPNFIPHTSVWDLPIPHLRPSYQSGWTWFLQFCSCQTSIQVHFWWFWVMVVLLLVVILMRLCEEVSNVCLLHHFHWKLTTGRFKNNNGINAKIIDTLSFKFSLSLWFWDRVIYTWFKESGF